MDSIIMILPIGVIALLIGCVIGILTGVFGAGGGFLITPALHILIGLPMTLAVGTSSCQILGASTFSLLFKFERKLLDIKLIALLGGGIPPGVWAGGLAVELLKKTESANPWRFLTADFILLVILALFLLMIAGVMFLDNFCFSGKKPMVKGILSNWKIPPMLNFSTLSSEKFSGTVLACAGLLLGFVSGLLGIGGGVIIFPILYYLIGQETLAATKSSLVLVFLSGLFGSIIHGLHGNIDYHLAILLICGALLGSKLGLMIQSHLNATQIRRYFVLVVLFAWIIVSGKIWSMCH